MGKQKKQSNKLYTGMKGWEINYLKQAEKYGHLVPQGKGSSKQRHKYNKGN